MRCGDTGRDTGQLGLTGGDMELLDNGCLFPSGMAHHPYPMTPIKLLHACLVDMTHAQCVEGLIWNAMPVYPHARWVEAGVFADVPPPPHARIGRAALGRTIRSVPLVAPPSTDVARQMFNEMAQGCRII